MVIPKYIKAMMGRARFVRGLGDPGYTVEIVKATPYTTAETFKMEVERLCAWVERQMPRDEFSIPTAVINNIPRKTHHCRQVAVVTIYDPVMQHLEKLIKE